MRQKRKNRLIAPEFDNREKSVSNRYDRAISLVASGYSQKKVAETLGCSESRLSKVLNTEEGQRRLDYWIRCEIKALLVECH